jgi:hypothetical protein
VETPLDYAESAISDLAIGLAIIDGDQCSIEFEVLDNCEVDTMFCQIAEAFALILNETLAIHDLI